MCAAGIATGAGICYRGVRALFASDEFRMRDVNEVDPKYWYEQTGATGSLEIAITTNLECHYVCKVAEDIATLTTPAFTGGGVYIDVPYRDSIIAVRMWTQFWEWLLNLPDKRLQPGMDHQRTAFYNALRQGATLHVSFCVRVEEGRDLLGMTFVGLPPALLQDFAVFLKNSSSFGSGKVKLLDFRNKGIVTV